MTLKSYEDVYRREIQNKQKKLWKQKAKEELQSPSERFKSKLPSFSKSFDKKLKSKMTYRTGNPLSRILPTNKTVVRVG